jgi:hypothetical protein
MINYQTFKDINYLHDQLHLSNSDLTRDTIQERQPDESCTICFPPLPAYNLYFTYFWDWFCITFPATQYSFKTYYYFVRHGKTLFPYIGTIQRLILTIRYSEPVHLDRITEETFTAFHIYYNFVFDPFDIDIVQPSPSLDIPFTTQPNIDNLFEETSSNSSEHISNTPSTISENNYSSDSEEFNLDLLFRENTMANSQDVLNYLKSNVNNQILRIEPFFGDGTQDPLTWWAAFTKARKSNGWQEAKAYQMFAAHLQDEADDWWTTYSGTNGDDFTVNAYRWDRDLETAFEAKFCT